MDNSFDNAFSAHPERFFIVQSGKLLWKAEPMEGMGHFILPSLTLLCRILSFSCSVTLTDAYVHMCLCEGCGLRYNANTERGGYDITELARELTKLLDRC